MSLASAAVAERGIDLGNDDARAFAPEPLGEGEAQAAPCPGDDDAFAGKSLRHGRPYVQIAFADDGVLKIVGFDRGHRA